MVSDERCWLCNGPILVEFNNLERGRKGNSPDKTFICFHDSLCSVSNGGQSLKALAYRGQAEAPLPWISSSSAILRFSL